MNNAAEKSERQLKQLTGGENPIPQNWVNRTADEPKMASRGSWVPDAMCMLAHSLALAKWLMNYNNLLLVMFELHKINNHPRANVKHLIQSITFSRMINSSL
jgi:hypothetical protein